MGVGRHTMGVDTSHLEHLQIVKKHPLFWWNQSLNLQVFTAGQPLWAISNTTVKLSILHLYTQIFPGPILRRICHILAAFSWSYFVMVFIQSFAFCHPVSYNWDKSIDGTCHDPAMAYLLAGITNLVLDVIIVYLLMPLLWMLQMSRTKKLGISAMFSLGAMSVFASFFLPFFLSLPTSTFSIPNKPHFY